MERCPSCNAPVNTNSNFCIECGCNLKESLESVSPENSIKRSYRLRSPILESAILYDDVTEKKHGTLIMAANCFWIFAVIFLISGGKILYDNYATTLFKGIMDASLSFALSLLCFIVPGLVRLFVDIEENLSALVKETKKDKID